MIQLTRSILSLVNEFIEDPEFDDVSYDHDINDGYCADFATELWEGYGRSYLDIVSDEDFIECGMTHEGRDGPHGDNYTHTFIHYDGKFYDSEAPYGVDDWRDLPIFKRQKENYGRDLSRAETDVRRMQAECI